MGRNTMRLNYCMVLLVSFFAVLPLPVYASTTKPMPPLATGHGAPVAPADPNNFSFVTGGDNRSTGYGYPMPACFAQICSEIGILKPPFVVWTGDCIQGYGDSVGDANAEYDVFLNTLKLTNAPVFNAPGNHEFSLDIKLLAVYLKRMSPLYSSFDYGNSHFVLINTNAVEADNTIHDGSLDDAQWAWLESDLKANQSAKNIFVFMHHYPFGPTDPDTPKNGETGWASVGERDRFHALMIKYGVRAVFAATTTSITTRLEIKSTTISVAEPELRSTQVPTRAVFSTIFWSMSTTTRRPSVSCSLTILTLRIRKATLQT